MTPEDWRRLVGERVERQRGRKPVRAIARRAGVSEGLWRQIESGRRVLAKDVVRTVSLKPETAALVSRALGWTESGIDDLLAGRRPAYLLVNNAGPIVITIDDDTIAATGTVTVTPEALALLDARVTTLEGHDVEALHQQVVALAKEVRRLQRQLGKLGAASVQEARQARRRAAGSPE